MLVKPLKDNHAAIGYGCSIKEFEEMLLPVLNRVRVA